MWLFTRKALIKQQLQRKQVDFGAIIFSNVYLRDSKYTAAA